MKPSEWPLRFVPQRSPPLWQAVLVTLAAFAGAVLIRALLLGFANATSISATYFPAFILATLYAGPRWGWGSLVFIMVAGYLQTNSVTSTLSRDAVILQFGLSGAATVLVAQVLRETLLRLEESKAAEAKVQADLIATEARFRTLADSAPVLMWVSKLDGSREFVNRAYLDFLGLDYDEAIKFDWRGMIHPDDLHRIAAEEAKSLADGGDFIWEARYRSSTGEHPWIRSISQRRYAPNGELAGYIGVGYDVSDAKRAQADLTRINDLLAERVQAALAERDLAEAALRRAQKLEAVGQLTGGVAHDFNNLLTVIIGALDLMLRHPGDAARRERMIEAALGAAKRGERLTQQLLAFSRRQALKPELVLIDELLAESEPLLRRAVGEAVTLAIEPVGGGAVCNIDPSQFEAAVMNLVVNARDATPPGGSIRVETHPCVLKAGEAEDAPAGDYLCVSVHDTGAGMDDDTASRVFEPFFTTKEPGRGTGLGLSQVYGFARQSGGAALVESAPGKGATLRIYLPLAEAVAGRPAAPPEAQAMAHGPPRRVLLVEDDASVGEMVEAMLADLGHEVLRAEAAAPAIEILGRKDRIDLMLTDLIMPGGMNGVELAHAAVALRPGLPVILTSGYTGETLGAAAQAPWPLLTKPYPAEALAAVIDAVMGKAPATV
ncbi:ATP-binding protein [Phenylobacterium sp.]|uniref:ATP-binding protein n=1 Tax=Phenylobacterium sp. TaxID=1871053 RepID=UPI00122781E3|nr:ATP-binding protein [Phenylobacterium sp.]THD50805.1 MAG: PAS domain S-box protein [Phenylobacterium sp.]